MKALTGPGLTGAKAPRSDGGRIPPQGDSLYKEVAVLAGVIAIACLLSSLCLVTFAFWDYGGWLSSLIGLTLVFILGVFALIAWAFVCAILD